MAAEVRGWCISGRVQGVFFRASTRRKAKQLNLAGYALNRSDGTVEVAARGEVESLVQLAQWLSKGPTAARVDEVVAFEPECEGVPVEEFRTG